MPPSTWSVVPLLSGTAADTAASLNLSQDGALIRRTVLPGGIRVLTEDIPATRSVALGAWVAVGSRDEAEAHAGSTHFLEHLLFKGTPHRSAYDIAAAFDAVGGEANAATAKNYTCYWARVLDADLPMAAEVIMDMVTSSLLDADEFETERGVILEELAMALDDPADLVHERFTETVLAGHPLGRPIGGTPETIAALGRDAVLAHYRSTYVPGELVITVAGNVHHEAVCDAVLAGARAAGWQLGDDATPAPRREATFGAFVSLSPGKDGLLHISQVRKIVGGKRVENVEDVLPVGSKVEVELAEIDSRGKLSLHVVIDGEAGPAEAGDRGGDRGDRGDRGGDRERRDGDRGDRRERRPRQRTRRRGEESSAVESLGSDAYGDGQPE